MDAMSWTRIFPAPACARPHGRVGPAGMPVPAFPAARTCSAGTGQAAGPPTVCSRHVSPSARPAPWCRHPDRAGHSRNTRPPSSRRDRWPARHGCARWHRCRMREGSAARSGSASPSARCAAHARGGIRPSAPAFETGFGNICHVMSSAGSPRPVCSSCPSDGRSPGLRPSRPPRLPGIAPSGMKRGTSRQQLRGQLRTWHAGMPHRYSLLRPCGHRSQVQTGPETAPRQAS